VNEKTESVTAKSWDALFFRDWIGQAEESGHVWTLALERRPPARQGLSITGKTRRIGERRSAPAGNWRKWPDAPGQEANL